VDLLFRLSNLLVLPFWAFMILLPRWRWTARLLRSPLVILAPAALYAALVFPRLAEIWPAVSQPTLAGVTALLGTPVGATIAWLHFLAFDLFVGRWIYLDSRGRGVSAWFMAPVLFLTLMLGPVGFLSYLAIRVRAANQEKASESLAVTNPSLHPVEGLRRALQRAWAINPALTILAVVMLLTFVAAIVGIFVDPRVITGAPAWLKPAKFAISVSTYCFTFVWLLGFVENHPRLVRLAANVTVVSIVVEMVAIITQAARGTTSHFNVSTPFDSFLWFAMGSFIVLVWTMNLLLAILLLRQRMPDRAFAWSLRLGVLISAVGMAAAFFMVTPTPEQAAAMAGGQRPLIVGAHSVGVADGGPGLPILGWSTVGGDLRAAHFAGLHALQILPLLGWLLTRCRGVLARLTANDRLTLVFTVGSTYLGLVLLLLWQALRGQSVIHPDGETLAVAAALFAVLTISAGIVAARRYKKTQVLSSAIQILSR